MFRKGPIPVAMHGVVEYLAGALFIAAPFLFGFDSDSAIAAAIVVGVVILIVAAITRGPTSLVNQLPIRLHVLLDYALAAALIVAPFVLGFSDEAAPTAFFLALGIAHLLITIGTRFVREEAAG